MFGKIIVEDRNLNIHKCPENCTCGKHRCLSKDMIGYVSGRLIVIAKAKTRGKRAYWLCQCECGKQCEVMGKLLRNKMTQSCGCIQKERARTMGVKLAPGEASFNQVYAGYKREAELRNLAFEMSKERFREISKKDCFYCGAPPSNVHGYFRKYSTGSYVYNGVDRKDSFVGYVEGNIVPCCAVHNFMKKRMSAEDFIFYCKAVADYQEKRAQESSEPSHLEMVAN